MAIIVTTAFLRRAARPRGSIQRGADVQLRSVISPCASHTGFQRIEIAPDTFCLSYIVPLLCAGAL